MKVQRFTERKYNVEVDGRSRKKWELKKSMCDCGRNTDDKSRVMRGSIVLDNS